MRCKEFEKQLAAYWAEELQGPRRQAFDQHLANCQRCRALVETEESISPLWRRMSAAEPGPTVWNRIESRLRSEPQAASTPLLEAASRFLRSFLSPRPALAVAAFLALTIGAALVWQLSLKQSWLRSGSAESWSSAPQSIERKNQPEEPSWREFPEVLAAASAVLNQAQSYPRGEDLSRLPAKSEVVVREFARFPIDRVLNRQLSPLLSDVEIALTELSAARRDSNPRAKLEEVQRMVQRKDLLTRLAVARTLVDALAAEQTPPEIIEAFTRPAR